MHAIPSLRSAPRRGRFAIVALAAAACFLAALAFTARADAFLYWTVRGSGTIERANDDGSGVVTDFITEMNEPWGVAVDGAHIYWGSRSNDDLNDTIGRADLNGGSVDNSFITDAAAPSGVAVDGAYVYWSNGGTIGRANLDGTGVDQSFIAVPGEFPGGVAVDGAHVYWTDFNDAPPFGTTIGRANLDGTGVDQSFITGASVPSGVAVNGTHIYWANAGSGTIGRANLDGTGVDESFITGSNSPVAVAVDRTHIFWASENPRTIGRANLDGTGVDESFITDADATGLAVGPTTIHDLIVAVQRLRRVPADIEQRLLVILQTAQQNLDAGNLPATCQGLTGFSSEVQTLKGTSIPAREARSLVSEDRDVRQSLRCGRVG